MISVVIPAHDEGNVLARTLEVLLADSDPDELEVIVVCNGCKDDTAAIARRFEPGVRVIETEHAGKALALNLGDEAASSFPRVFLDADVELRIDALRRVAEALRTPGAMLAAPRIEVDLEGCSYPVRAYYRIWLELPYVREEMTGSGVYALSKEGRTRFDRFPDLIADDLFVHDLFGPGERRALPDATFRIRAARNTRDLIRRKTRVFVGNAQLHRAGLTRPGSQPLGGTFGGVLWRSPGLLIHAPAYLWINGIAKLRAQRRLRRGEVRDWGQDASSRADAPGGETP